MRSIINTKFKYSCKKDLKKKVFSIKVWTSLKKFTFTISISSREMSLIYKPVALLETSAHQLNNYNDPQGTEKGWKLIFSFLSLFNFFFLFIKFNAGNICLETRRRVKSFDKLARRKNIRRWIGKMEIKPTFKEKSIFFFF